MQNSDQAFLPGTGTEQRLPGIAAEQRHSPGTGTERAMALFTGMGTEQTPRRWHDSRTGGA